MKSDVEIEKWVYRKIKGSSLERTVNGKLSDRGRPNKSEKEDIVIATLANDGCGQSQQAYVNVNIYVKDQWNESTKSWEKDTRRIVELCQRSKMLFSLLESEYRVIPQHSSQHVMPTGVVFEDGHTEHFINNRLYIKIITDNAD